MSVLRLVVPIRTVSLTNQREHWRARHRRVSLERTAVWAYWLAQAPDLPETWVRACVRLTRLSPGELDDDNLRGALKAVRDQVADELKVDDKDPRVEWFYAQRRSPEYAVEIAVTLIGGKG